MTEPRDILGPQLEKIRRESLGNGYAYGRYDAGDTRLPTIEDAWKFGQYFAERGSEANLKREYETFVNHLKGTP